MSEEHVGFLFKIATLFKNTENNRSSSLLQSYYLLQCKEITRGFGLPQNQFSPKTRCSYCCLEWRNGTVRKMKPIKLSRKQRRRINRLKDNNENLKKNEYVASKKELLKSKELEQVCSFCNHKSVIAVPRPVKEKSKETDRLKELEMTKISNKKKVLMATTNKKITKSEVEDKTLDDKQNPVLVNVYSKTSHVFSLQNKNNTLKSTIKKPATVIKNNKKKKDKFAGLCQTAVLASAKLKEEKNNKNKINLFLKKST